MTKEELDIIRVRAHVEALHVLFVGLYVGLANSTEGGAQAARESFARLREQHSKVALKGVDAALSDMVSGEYQDALDVLLKDIESRLK